MSSSFSAFSGEYTLEYWAAEVQRGLSLEQVPEKLRARVARRVGRAGGPPPRRPPRMRQRAGKRPLRRLWAALRLRSGGAAVWGWRWLWLCLSSAWPLCFGCWAGCLLALAAAASWKDWAGERRRRALLGALWKVGQRCRLGRYAESHHRSVGPQGQRQVLRFT